MIVTTQSTKAEKIMTQINISETLKQIDVYIEARMIRMSAFSFDERQSGSLEKESLLAFFDASSDEELLSKLLEIMDFFKYDIDLWIQEANYRKLVQDKSNFFMNQSKGFPVDFDLLLKVLGNSFDICKMAALEANELIPDLFQINHIYKSIKVKREVLREAFPSLDQDFELQETIAGFKYHPKFNKIYLAKNTADNLLGKVAKQLPNLLNQNHIKTQDHVYSTITGRNAPKTTEGFLLNCHPWIRTLIKPQPGQAFIKFDWVGQESWVMAVLSGDDKLLQGYQNGDVYCYVGHHLGLIPEGATREDYPDERDLAKQLQLGISYGQGKNSLSIRVQDGDILALKHRQVFTQYWNWVNDTIHTSFEKTYYKTRDGWLYFLPPSTSKHLMYNAPIQSEAAGLMRSALMLIDPRVNVVATHYDALYVTCDISQIDYMVSYIIEVMNTAAHNYFGVNHHPYVKPEIFTSNYIDPRGVDFFKKVNTLSIPTV
jgi:hypothetical protein